MSIWFWALLIAVALIGWLVAYMLAQRPITNAQQLLQLRRYEDAVMEAAISSGDSAARAVTGLRSASRKRMRRG